MLKLGILNAISPETSVVNWGGTPFDTYRRFFESVNASFTYAGTPLQPLLLAKSGEGHQFVAEFEW